MYSYVERDRVKVAMNSQCEVRYADDIYVWRCVGCGFVYDELMGQHERGIFPGTVWKDLPEDWSCSACGAQKTRFVPQPLEEYLALCVGIHIDELSAGKRMR